VQLHIALGVPFSLGLLLVLKIPPQPYSGTSLITFLFVLKQRTETCMVLIIMNCRNTMNKYLVFIIYVYNVQ
jgi:hypothetical protein